jgi:hypothetical protein
MPSRINVRSMTPDKPAPVKKDSSFLDWHYKMPTEEELQDPYICYPEGFWAPFFQAAKEASTLPPRKKNDPDQLRDAIKRDACEDCSLPMQMLMQRLDRCHPVEGAVTPEDMKRLGILGEDGWLKRDAAT